MSEPVRIFLEFPIEAGEAWLAQVQQVAAPHVERLGHVQHPEKMVVICELLPESRPALMEALQQAWSDFQARSDQDAAESGSRPGSL